MQALAELVTRVMDISVTISDNMVYVSVINKACEVSWIQLQKTQ